MPAIYLRKKKSIWNVCVLQVHLESFVILRLNCALHYVADERTRSLADQGVKTYCVMSYVYLLSTYK
jgi:hypothetical protein